MSSVQVSADPPLPADRNPLAPKIAAYECELDQLWGPTRAKGGWRKKEPFDKAPWKTLQRIKYLLKRRERAIRGFDVEVDIVVPNKRKPERCFALARDPAPDAVPFDPAKPLLPAAPVWTAPDASVLAFDLHMPLERVEAALARIPVAYQSDDGARAWCRLVDDGVKAAVAAGGAPRAAESPALSTTN